MSSHEKPLHHQSAENDSIVAEISEASARAFFDQNNHPHKLAEAMEATVIAGNRLAGLLLSRGRKIENESTSPTNAYLAGVMDGMGLMKRLERERELQERFGPEALSDDTPKTNIRIVSDEEAA